MFATVVNFQALLVFAGIVSVWAFIRPAMIRDNDNRQLPQNIAARLIFVLMYVIAYLGMCSTFLFSRDIVMRVSEATPLGSAFKSLQDQAPLLGLISLFSLQALAPLREIERALVIWMHSARHFHNDIVALTTHLQTCAFEPSDDERRKNVESLAPEDVYLTDTSTGAIDLTAVDYWRKVATLLRIVREWNVDDGRVLSDEQMALVAEIETAHTRKTRLALQIVRMLDHVEQSAGAGPTLAELAQILATSHSDRSAVTDAEKRAHSALTTAERRRQPVRLSSKQLRNLLAQIEGYFQVEYKLLLEQIANLAAISIVHSERQAPERLEQIRTAGFDGLGSLRPINFDRILWVFLAVTAGGFLIFYFILPKPDVDHPLMAPGRLLQSPAIHALVMAIATLVAALVGSKRSLARSLETPWATYLLAGSITALLYLIVEGASLVVATSQAMPGASRAPPPDWAQLLELAPWAAAPFMITVGICRLARVWAWPKPDAVREPWQTSVWERLCDGIVLSLVMVVAFALSTAVTESFGFGYATSLAVVRLNLGLFGPLMLLGFFIGFLAVQEIRIAAHTEIIEPTSTERLAHVAAIKPQTVAGLPPG